MGIPNGVPGQIDGFLARMLEDNAADFAQDSPRAATAASEPCCPEVFVIVIPLKSVLFVRTLTSVKPDDFTTWASGSP